MGEPSISALQARVTSTQFAEWAAEYTLRDEERRKNEAVARVAAAS